MKFDRPLTKEEKQYYVKVCFKMWGGDPVDVDWAVRTGVYQKALVELKKEKNDKII